MLTLNRQEKLNAKWFGDFKQTAYKLAAEQFALDAWRKLRAFTNIQIARMKEVKLTSDVLVAIVRGISDITAIAKAYENFDAEFPKREVAKDTFVQALKFVTDELSGAVRATRFHNRAWFYSLMVATADATVGIPNGLGPAKLQLGQEVQKRLFDLDQALRILEMPLGVADVKRTQVRTGLNELREAMGRGTSHVRPRQVRHEHFFAMLTLANDEWRQRWESLRGVR